MANTIGIDFGTTKTMVSYLNPATGKAELVRLGRDRDSIPTTVHVDEAGAFLFGDDADDQIATDPEGYCRAFKLHLGESDSLLPRAGAAAEELARRFLLHVKEECEQNVFHGEVIDTATITVPVSFSPARMASLKRAAEAAGFAKVTFLPEPEAAGTAFLRDNPADKFSRALVLDWGGGTLDIAIISRDDDGSIHADSHCVEGRDDVGGEEMDRRLLAAGDEYWRQTFGASLIETEENEPKLLREAEKVKVGLSRKEAVTFRRGTKKVDVSREHFQQLIGEMLNSAVALVKSALSKNEKQGNPAPDAILLIGGASQVPAVRNTMEANFPNLRVLSWHHSHEAVALGATTLSGLPPSEALSWQDAPTSLHNSVDEAPHHSSELPVAKVDDIGAMSLPEPFCGASNALGEKLVSLGKPLSMEIVEYYGYGAPCKALRMENGLLVWRNRLWQFSLVHNIFDGQECIDILLNPNIIDIDGLGSSDSLFHIRELECQEKLERQGEELHRQQGAIDWYQGNNSTQYSQKRQKLQRDLANLESEKGELEKQFLNTKANAKTGIFASVGTWWKASGIESDIAQKKKQIEAKLNELRENHDEAERHANWPESEHLNELAKGENAYQDVFLEYCIARHFRNRLEVEVVKERESLNELDIEIGTLRNSAAAAELAIEDMERRLPIMKSELASAKSQLAEKERRRGDLDVALKEREQSLNGSFTSLLSQKGTENI